jgi:hypothetical protein
MQAQCRGSLLDATGILAEAFRCSCLLKKFQQDQLEDESIADRQTRSDFRSTDNTSDILVSLPELRTHSRDRITNERGLRRLSRYRRGYAVDQVDPEIAPNRGADRVAGCPVLI